jgi:hypothetical protein
MMPPADRIASPTLYRSEYHGNLTVTQVFVNRRFSIRPMLPFSVTSLQQNGAGRPERFLVTFLVSRMTIVGLQLCLVREVH